MTQADRVFNTPPTDASSETERAAPTGLGRRAFVAALAGGAAAAMVAPAASLASGEADPIFAQIEAHRALAKEHAAACTEQSRREDILIDEGIGLCPFVTMVWQGRPMVAHSHKQIDAYDSISEKVRARAHAELDTTLACYHEVFGNIENEAGEIGDAARRVFLYVHSANCYPENSQSTANCSNCSFEPECYHRRALSSFDHFTQLLVLSGLPKASAVARTHSTSRITRRRFIRSSAWTISGLSSTASRRSTVRVASRGPGSMYSPRMRLASSTARIRVSWSGFFIAARNSTNRIQGSRGQFVPAGTTFKTSHW